MTRYEYKVIPAPAKGRKAPGVKGPEARFAHGLEEVMNELGAEGWDYLRSDLLPSEERQGLTSSHTVYRSVLVFRRPLTGPAEVSSRPATVPATDPAPDGDTATETPDHADTPETAADTPDEPTDGQATETLPRG